MWDILSVEKIHNLTLPAWTDPVFPARLGIMAELGFSIRSLTPYMRLVKGGPLVKKIFDQMLEKHNEKSLSRSIYIYSGHDTTLLSVIKLLNLTNQSTSIPEYGATLVFELHCDEDNDCKQLEVKVSFLTKFQ